MPCPAGFVVTHGSKTRGNNSGGMPPPVSVISIRTPAPFGQAAIVNVPPSGIASRPLLTRFSNASSSSWLSASTVGSSEATLTRSAIFDASSFGRETSATCASSVPSATGHRVSGRRA